MRCAFTRICFIFIALLACAPAALAQDGAAGDSLLYSFITTWGTGGDHQLLARKAAAIGQFKNQNTLAISFGSLIGETRLVENDNGLRFLRAAKEGGLDCVIPAAGEFLPGVQNLRILSEFSGVPVFLSANIVVERTMQPVFTPYIIRNFAGLRICVIGLSDTDIIMNTPDENVTGIEVLPFEEALEKIMDRVAGEYPDRVVVAGRIGRPVIENLVRRFPAIDTFITNRRSEGFVDKFSSATSIIVADRPVYIALEEPNTLGRLTVNYSDGIETRAFSTITLPDDYTASEKILENLGAVIEEIEQRDREEQSIRKAGEEVASILADYYEPDAVLIDREALYYYPLEDSLTLFELEKVVKPDRGLVRLTLEGRHLASILERSEEADPPEKLHVGGISDDGKIDDIPIQDDRSYDIVTTARLAGGGLGYNQFYLAETRTILSETMLEVVEGYLVEKDRRIREAEEVKNWSLSLNLSIGSNFNKTEVDKDQELYGDVPPKEFRSLKDLFTGLFEIQSWDDKFTLTLKRHLIESRLRARYMRSGYRTEEGDLTYKEGGDDLQLFNKYTYDLPGFKLKPFGAIDVYSEFYSPGGRHPIRASARAGLSREIKSLWGMVLEVGLDGTRNYVNNENTFGTTNKFTLSKSFPAKGLFSTPTKLSIDAQMTWNPMAKYHMAFFMRNSNKIDFQIWKRLNATFHVRSYAYRDTRHRKVAIGFIYNFMISYLMDWNL